MKKKNKHPTKYPNEEVIPDDNSENLIETLNYIKKLEHQRDILNKLLASGIQKPLKRETTQIKPAEIKQQITNNKS
jgi:hypothetical protein